ncbi:hypothetical protein [Synechococcus sp. LA31]|uniref:hypothetical protein n=1 Tax=Synechococcus sp. LA31 TaxID=2741953 RepID=UPI001BDD8619|nr:hypothetical protein [Synechococcus sp. LA31]QVV66766.1 hypothetical protein KJJ24_09745 [Synechococcus sp. LA31]
MARKQKEVDPTLLSAGTWSAIVEGWELENQRELSRSKAPMRHSLKTPMRMSGGSYAVGKGINAPMDPVSGVPIVGPG